MIHTVTLNPSLDKTAHCDEFEKNGLNRIEIVSYDAGGKGINVSKTIQALNGVSTAYTILGGAIGESIKGVLQSRFIPVFSSEIEENTRVNLKVIDKQKKLTEFNELGPYIDEKNVQEVLDALRVNVKPFDVVVFSGSLPRGVESDTYKKLVIEMKKIGAIVILDASGVAFVEGVEAIPTIIKPNKKELCEYFNTPDLSVEECVLKAREFIDKGVILVVVSLGIEGALYVTKEDTYHALPIKVETKSTVGAGDALVAGIAYGYDHKYTFEEIVKLSMAAATGAVTTTGTKPADQKMVKGLMKGVVVKKK